MKQSIKKIKLLPLEKLNKTGEVDHADWNYKKILGYIQRQRFKLCLRLLDNKHFNSLLEIGYGSGIFIPQLKDFCTNLYGIDIHNQNKKVSETLSDLNIKANLFSSSAESIPLEDNFFDAVISISSIEFIKNLDAACAEIKRVLKKEGFFYLIIPGQSKILDAGLKILTGESAANDYEGRREKVIPALLRYFTIKQSLYFPEFGFPIKLYTGLKLIPKL